MESVRVRFAPSPTGFFHIGGARTALFNWLYARHSGGTFILRIEDTDTARNTSEALDILMDGMRWLGLDWDEGPGKGGDFGPYFQSERSAIYEHYMEQLIANGRAYEKDGAIFFKQLGEHYTCFDKFKNAQVEKIKASPVILNDAVRGRVERVVDQDFVIRRSNGDFSFHFVNVIDDMTMRVSHVIRGEDHLSNTAKHVEIFKALGAELPVYAHIPLILKSNGKGKMSKRESGALLEEYQRQYMIPQAVRNFLCLLGWNPKDGREIMAIQEIIERFDFDAIQKDGARFDEKKLANMNMQYLRDLNLETFAWMAAPVLIEAGLIDAHTDEDYLQAVLSIAQEKARDFVGLPELLAYFFQDDFEVDAKVREKLEKKGDPKKRLQEFLESMEQIDSWSDVAIESKIECLAIKQGVDKFAYYPALRLAVSGKGGGPDLIPMMRILGRERVRARLRGYVS